MNSPSSSLALEDPTTGLSTASVLRQKEIDGFNELPTGKTRRFHQIVIELVREPMVYLLLGCGAVYGILGDRQEAGMLLGFLLIIVGITTYQERKAERALERLRDLSSPRALVIRDGRKQRIPGREVVRGDIAVIGEGDRVPADGGAWRISQRRVLTRRMPAIENLGATTVLCVDKTGTLTLNRMALRELVVGDAHLDLASWKEPFVPEAFHEVLEYGILASPSGSVRPNGTSIRIGGKPVSFQDRAPSPGLGA